MAINSGTSGANGLDTGSLAASTWYYLYLIYNGTTVAGLMSASSSAPTLPSGYTYSSLIGVALTDGSKNFVGLKAAGNDYQYVVGSNLSAVPQIASGNAGSTSIPTWVPLAVTSFVPPIASKIKLCIATYSPSGGQYIVAPNNNYGAFGASTNPPLISNQPYNFGDSDLVEMILDPRIFTGQRRSATYRSTAAAFLSTSRSDHVIRPLRLFEQRHVLPGGPAGLFPPARRGGLCRCSDAHGIDGGFFRIRGGLCRFCRHGRRAGRACRWRPDLIFRYAVAKRDLCN